MQLDLNTCTGLKQWAGDNHDGQKRKGRFSLRFNIGDPVQRAAVELLELQPPHSKAQYIANALVYYNTHFSDDPQPLKVPAIDRAAIEAIVREIMRQDEQASDKAVSTGEWRLSVEMAKKEVWERSCADSHTSSFSCMAAIK